MRSFLVSGNTSDADTIVGKKTKKKERKKKRLREREREREREIEKGE